MKASQLAVRLAVTPLGAALDRYAVRLFGESPVSWIFARSEGVEYNPPILLTTRGRKTGKSRTVVLPHFSVGVSVRVSGGVTAGEHRIAIVGSRGGMPTDPHWARNLKAHPEARIWIDRRAVDVEVELAEGATRESLWASITARSPIYLEYQRRAAAHREIPVFMLTAKDGTRLSAPG
jgi:deazaflavin-dependent oxidoreductase (nitroreductase family)